MHDDRNNNALQWMALAASVAFALRTHKDRWTDVVTYRFTLFRHVEIRRLWYDILKWQNLVFKRKTISRHTRESDETALVAWKKIHSLKYLWRPGMWQLHLRLLLIAVAYVLRVLFACIVLSWIEMWHRRIFRPSALLHLKNDTFRTDSSSNFLVTYERLCRSCSRTCCCSFDKVTATVLSDESSWWSRLGSSFGLDPCFTYCDILFLSMARLALDTIHFLGARLTLGTFIRCWQNTHT